MPKSAIKSISLAALMLAACRAEPVANDIAAPLPEIATPPAEAVSETNAAEPAAEPQAAQPVVRYRFLGTEPFWGGTIDGATILYRTPEDQAGKTITATATKEGAATRYSGALDGQPFILTLTPGTCSDGMSDTVYPLNAALTVHGEQRQGCANPIVGTQ
jgi:uncharacterized membrane protein